MGDNLTAPVAGAKFKTKDTGANGHVPAHHIVDTAEAAILGLLTASPDKDSLAGRLKDIAGNDYETVAASSGPQSLGATGAAGDYLRSVLIIPGTLGAGTVSITDGGGSAINIFVTGTLADLKPITVHVGARSVSGAWKITTGANVTAIGFGRFT